MTHDRTHDRADRTRRADPALDAVEPGHLSRSAALLRRASPEPSGLVGRDDNGVAAHADTAVSAAATSSGSPLPAPLLRKFEASLGADLSAVRVHTGDASASAADAVGAKAYTVGQDVHFGAGHFDPASSTGEHLLAHEVAHTVQQAGRVQFKLAVSSPGDHLEQEADRAADAMVAGKAASVGGAGGGLAREVVDPDTYKTKDPDHETAADVHTDADTVTWNEKWHMADGSIQVKQHTAYDVYGAKAQLDGVKPDPNDPYATEHLDPWDWSRGELVAPAEPGPWDITLTMRQPLPAMAPDSTLGLGKLSPLPVQPSQIAFAQGCVNAFAAPHAQVKQSWQVAGGLVRDFNTAGKNSDYWEGGTNWIPSTKPSEAQQGQALDQLVDGVKVGHTDAGPATSTVKAVTQLSDKDIGGLTSNIPTKNMDTLQDKAGTVAAKVTVLRESIKGVQAKLGDQARLEAQVALAKSALDLSVIENDKDIVEADRDKARAECEEAKKAAELVMQIIEIGVATAKEPLGGVEKAGMFALKATADTLATAKHERDIKQQTKRLRELSVALHAKSAKIRVEQVTLATVAVEAKIDEIASAKKLLATAVKDVDDAYGAFAAQAGKQIGGAKGEQVKAALEALPKIAYVARTCDDIVKAISLPAFDRMAGIGMLGSASSPRAFVDRVQQLRAMQTTFTAKAKHWNDVRTKLEAVAKSYGLGD